MPGDYALIVRLLRQEPEYPQPRHLLDAAGDEDQVVGLPQALQRLERQAGDLPLAAATLRLVAQLGLIQVGLRRCRGSWHS